MDPAGFDATCGLASSAGTLACVHFAKFTQARVPVLLNAHRTSSLIDHMPNYLVVSSCRSNRNTQPCCWPVTKPHPALRVHIQFPNRVLKNAERIKWSPCRYPDRACSKTSGRYEEYQIFPSRSIPHRIRCGVFQRQLKFHEGLRLRDQTGPELASRRIRRTTPFRPRLEQFAEGFRQSAAATIQPVVLFSYPFHKSFQWV